MTIRGSAEIQLVWVPAPGWPAPPTDDWRPSSRWTPDSSWPDWRGHDFWQVRGEAEIVATYTRKPEAPPRGLEGASKEDHWRRAVNTPGGQLSELNSVEQALRSLSRWRAEWDEVDESDRAIGVVPLTGHPSQVSRESAWSNLVEAAETTRTHLILAISQMRPVHEGYFGWRAATDMRLDAYSDANRTVLDAFMNWRQARLDQIMTPAQQHEWFWGRPAPDSEVEWQQAERLAERVLRQLGFDDVTTTGPGTDGGIDVAGSAIAGQVKYTRTPVGRPVMQQLAGAAEGRIAVFFSRAGYTKESRAYADAAGVALFSISLPANVTAVNPIAARMTKAQYGNSVECGHVAPPHDSSTWVPRRVP